MHRPALLLLLVALLLAGCGSHRPSVADCLNDKGFLVQGTGPVVRGSSPGGVNFTLTVYGGAAGARRAFARTSAKSAALLGDAVVDFAGNPPTPAGGPPARLSQHALQLIRTCLTSR
jgi:hypothetical protein